MEHGVFEQLYGGDGISAVKALAIANRQGIPIFQVTPKNMQTVMPHLTLPSAVMTDITNAVNAGKVVTVPQREITHLGWRGVGYTVIDPTTGAGGYIISGGRAGGEFLGNGINFGKLIDFVPSLFVATAEASEGVAAEQRNFGRSEQGNFIKILGCLLRDPSFYFLLAYLVAIIFLFPAKITAIRFLINYIATTASLGFITFECAQQVTLRKKKLILLA